MRQDLPTGTATFLFTDVLELDAALCAVLEQEDPVLLVRAVDVARPLGYAWLSLARQTP
jgi:hypothetical protein